MEHVIEDIGKTIWFNNNSRILEIDWFDERIEFASVLYNHSDDSIELLEYDNLDIIRDPENRYSLSDWLADNEDSIIDYLIENSLVTLSDEDDETLSP